jgi:hypothetical protein
MRAVQLGGAIGARVTASPEAWDWDWADLVVLVKRAAIRWQAEARRLKVPVVWDVLDFWAQPEDNALPREAMIAKVKAIQEAAGVSVLIGATQAMAEDIGGVYLPHHCRIGLAPAPIRDRAEVVAYEGTPKYLGQWRLALERSCASLGMRFVVNPIDIRHADVLVSFRDGKWDGWACRAWKSGVKQVNALVAGRPVLAQASAAGDEIITTGITFESMSYLSDALATITRWEVREDALQQGLNRGQEYQLPSVARSYAEVLRQSARRAA